MTFNKAAFANTLFQLAADASDLGHDDSLHAQSISGAFRDLATAYETRQDADAAGRALQRILVSAIAIRDAALSIRNTNATLTASLARSERERDGYRADVERLRGELATAVRDISEMQADLETVRGQANRSDEEWITADNRAKEAAQARDAALHMLRRVSDAIGTNCTYGMVRDYGDPARRLFNVYESAVAFLQYDNA